MWNETGMEFEDSFLSTGLTEIVSSVPIARIKEVEGVCSGKKDIVTS